MNIDNPFYKKTNFYLSVLALLLAIIALTLYALNCPSEFNGGAVSSAVVTADIVAIICMAIAIAASVAESFIKEKPILNDIFSYRRFLNYIAFVTLLYSFFMSILAEYSLIGTILYPIVSGTVGDPVEPIISFSYFAKLIGTLCAVILISAVALIQRSGFYKSQKDKVHLLTETEARGD